MSKGDINRNILDYMETGSGKKFSYVIISLINACIKEEYDNRKAENISIRSKTTEGKKQINKRVAALVNERLNKNIISYEDVALYKICRMQEYENRYNKCAWGFKSTRKRLGYDEETGLAKEDE